MSEVKNLPASIRQRLLNKAYATSRPYNELLQYFAIELFLYRLSRSVYVDKFILKGALMFLVWEAPGFRPTRDIDLLGFSSNDMDTVIQLFQEVCALEVEPDGMVFDTHSIKAERIKEDADYEGIRVRIIAYLGKARVGLQIDIGFADVVSPAPLLVDYPTILPMPAPHLRGYSAESVIAEKLQALAILGEVNTRMKDYYDLWILAKQFKFDGPRLQEAILQTFQRRNTAIPDTPLVGLTDRFAFEKQNQWQAFIQRIRAETGVASLSETIHALSGFLLPALQACARAERFNATWEPGGPWVYS